jgi:hypothetical protein
LPKALGQVRPAERLEELMGKERFADQLVDADFDGHFLSQFTVADVSSGGDSQDAAVRKTCLKPVQLRELLVLRAREIDQQPVNVGAAHDLTGMPEVAREQDLIARLEKDFLEKLRQIVLNPNKQSAHSSA